MVLEVEMNNNTNTTAAQNTAAEMVFTMGLPAAGKSYTAARLYPTHTAIDPDAVKESHPDYDPKNPAALHAWSQEVTEAIFAEAIRTGAGSFVVDGTGTNAEKMVRRINQAREAGFSVTLLYVTCDLETSLRRNAERTRVVPESIIRSKALDVATSFEIVSQYVDAVRVVENN